MALQARAAGFEAEVDKHLARHGSLDEAATEALYRRHIADFDPGAATRVSEGLQQLVSGMSASAALANDQTARYGHTLEKAKRLVLHTAFVDEAHRDNVKHVAGQSLRHFLSQTGDLDSAIPDFAVVGFDLTVQKTHQGGFACTIATDDTNAFVGFNGEVHFFQQQRATDAEINVLESYKRHPAILPCRNTIRQRYFVYSSFVPEINHDS